MTPALIVALNLLGAASLTADPATANVTMRVVEEHTDKPIACRVYVRSEQGDWHFARPADPAGSAIEYRKSRGDSVEMHTTVSAHPFQFSLPAGKYQITIERGKEYLPLEEQIEVGSKPIERIFKLQRWIDMADLGWYSGETHAHRPPEELPNLMLAEDLNVAVPLTYWVTEAFVAPQTGSKEKPRHYEPKPVSIDATHVYYPINTEYEIFTVGKARHTLGALFFLNHKEPLDRGVPPVAPVVEAARRQGAILELDKHNWPWSMMLVPVAKVDLYELTNNHIWRTNFAFTTWGEAPGEYMNIERDPAGGMTERGWIDFGFQNYYALVNCGFRMRPTAGTASGVHPVPLGFGRVYVHLPTGFSYEAWLKALNEGRSFVTTGPMLLATLDGKDPGETWRLGSPKQTLHLAGSVASIEPINRIEVIGAGKVIKALRPESQQRKMGGIETRFTVDIPIDGSTWIAVRCYERLANGRLRFAHTAPWHIDVRDQPLLPRPEEVKYLLNLMKQQLERNRGVLEPDAIAEYEIARKAYERFLPENRTD